MAKISFGEHGQFFTPMHVTDVMAQIVGATTGETVSDPCCGSGRMFISMDKLKKDLHYVGVDLSSTCAKMTVLNMWLFDLNADIYEGDSLSMKMSQMWKIRKGGFIYHKLVKEIPQPQKIQMQQTIFDIEEYKKAA
jgi:type I restriction-modification system DNA methylase subunit